MSAKDKLDELRTPLKKAGVKDVKFFFAQTGKTLSEVEADAARALQAFIDGAYTKLDVNALGNTAK